jgi:hypothetical protein
VNESKPATIAEILVRLVAAAVIGGFIRYELKIDARRAMFEARLG